MRNIFLVGAVIAILSVFAAAQGTGFSFQGRLNDGTTPANGSYDLQFELYSSITGGTKIGPTLPRPSTTLVNGVFSLTLDFGATAFSNSNPVFIEISVKAAGSSNAFTVLGPRQQLTVVPFAVWATNAVNADYAFNANNAQNAQTALVATNSENASLAANANALNGLSSSDFIRNSVAPIANQNFNIVGNGVINGTLYVAGSTTIGSPTITSNLNISGNITSAGNVAQNRDKGGLVKAMIYVKHDATIFRCYNGVTGLSTGNCGFSVSKGSGSTDGYYTINFGSQINDRFALVTPTTDGGNVNIGASLSFNASQPNVVYVSCFIPDVTWVDSSAANGFVLIVY